MWITISPLLIYHLDLIINQERERERKKETWSDQFLGDKSTSPRDHDCWCGAIWISACQITVIVVFVRSWIDVVCEYHVKNGSEREKEEEVVVAGWNLSSSSTVTIRSLSVSHHHNNKKKSLYFSDVGAFFSLRFRSQPYALYNWAFGGRCLVSPTLFILLSKPRYFQKAASSLSFSPARRTFSREYNESKSEIYRR